MYSVNSVCTVYHVYRKLQNVSKDTAVSLVQTNYINHSTLILILPLFVDHKREAGNAILNRIKLLQFLRIQWTDRGDLAAIIFKQLLISTTAR